VFLRILTWVKIPNSGSGENPEVPFPRKGRGKKEVHESMSGHLYRAISNWSNRETLIYEGQNPDFGVRL
jgi:hypothetical protein